MKSKQYPLLLVLVTLTYAATAELILSLAPLASNVSPVWPPTGVAIAAIWRLGYRVAPAVFLGAFLVNITTGGLPFAAALTISVFTTLEAVSAVYLLLRFTGLRNPFYNARDIVRFVLITGAVCAPLTATIGNLTLCLTGVAAWADFGSLWVTWWIGNAVGALVITPLLLAFPDTSSQRWTVRQIGELLLLIISLALVCDLVFGGFFFPKLVGYPLEHLTVPFLLWAAFRFGPLGAATTLAVLAAIAIWGTSRGFDALSTHAASQALMLTQVFLAATGITTLILAAIVNERRRTEEALRNKEMQLHLITDTTPVMLVQCSRQLRFRYVNRAYAGCFGLTPEQIIGKSVPEFMGENAFSTVRPYVERVLAGEPVEYEGAVPYRGAGIRFMRIGYMPERDDRGEVIGWVASLTDITDRKRDEEQIRSLNAELQRRIAEFVTLIDTAPVGIGVSMDPECSHIWGNPEFTNMLATNQNNLSKSGPAKEKLPFTILQNGREVLPADLPMQRACREGREVLDQEMEIVRIDGTVVHELVRATPLLDEMGKVRGCIGVFLNITDRKQAEKEREQLLEREQEARAAAEEASRIKDEFLAVISHELRTPLNSILGWAQLMNTGRLDAKTADRGRESIERNAQAQAKLIEDLLDVSRIMSGKLRLDVRPVDLASVIREAIDSLRHAMDAKEIQFEMHLEPAAGQVLGDATRLQQVIWNLLSNSAKFTPKRGRIEVRLQRNDTSAELRVTDTGHGIRPEFLPYVFDRFRQEDSSRTRKHGGLGLGLAIVHHLVELHGGTVEAFSAGEGQGATFTVSLPLARETGETGRAQTRLQVVPAAPTLAGLRLLVVEDDPDSLEMVLMVLRLQGADVRSATKASEAMHLIENWMPQVLIADIGLPDEDGYTLGKKIKAMALEKRKSIQAIAMTGYAGEQEGKRAIAAGFQIYLTKPTEPRRLVEAIANLVQREMRAAP